MKNVCLDKQFDFSEDYWRSIYEAAIAGCGIKAKSEFWIRLAHNKNLFKRIVRLVLQSKKAATSLNQARQIMKDNFIAPSVMAKHFGYHLSEKEKGFLKKVPFSKTTLQRCKRSHILIAVLPIPIIDIVQKNPLLFYNYSRVRSKSHALVESYDTASWHLIRKTPVLNSIDKTWEEQKKISLVNGMMTPTARLMVYSIIGYYLVTGKRLFKNVYVRSSDIDMDNYSIVVGDFDSSGLVIKSISNECRRLDMGLAGSRRFDYS